MVTDWVDTLDSYLMASISDCYWVASVYIAIQLHVDMRTYWGYLRETTRWDVHLVTDWVDILANYLVAKCLDCFWEVHIWISTQ